jgi:hypothetical protein
MHAHARVGDEEEQVGLADGLHDLLADLEIHRDDGVLDQAAGVDQPELAAVPLDAPEVPVARGARFLTDDRLVLADEDG